MATEGGDSQSTLHRMIQHLYKERKTAWKHVTSSRPGSVAGRRPEPLDYNLLQAMAPKVNREEEVTAQRERRKLMTPIAQQGGMSAAAAPAPSAGFGDADDGLLDPARSFDATQSMGGTLKRKNSMKQASEMRNLARSGAEVGTSFGTLRAMAEEAFSDFAEYLESAGGKLVTFVKEYDRDQRVSGAGWCCVPLLVLGRGNLIGLLFSSPFRLRFET